MTGTVTATPGAYPVTFTASDGASSTSQTMTVTVTPGNMTVPMALAQSFSTDQGTELTEPAGTLQAEVVDSNLAATSWTSQLTATATDGSVAVNPDGSFTYSPQAGFVGTDSFSYTLTDNLGYVSAPATVTLLVGTPPLSTTTTLPATTSTTLSTTTTTTIPTTPTTTVTTTTAPPVVATSATTTASSTTTTSPARELPHANQSYPNGAIVSFGGNDYVFAGGSAFLASAGELAALEKVDNAKVTAAPAGTSAPTATAPRSSTLLTTRAVNGDATIYFAGPDGQLHGFSTAHQLFSDGYDTALVVTVPSLGSLKVGSAAGADGRLPSRRLRTWQGCKRPTTPR